MHAGQTFRLFLTLAVFACAGLIPYFIADLALVNFVHFERVLHDLIVLQV